MSSLDQRFVIRITYTPDTYRHPLLGKPTANRSLLPPTYYAYTVATRQSTAGNDSASRKESAICLYTEAGAKRVLKDLKKDWERSIASGRNPRWTRSQDLPDLHVPWEHQIPTFDIVPVAVAFK